MWVNILRTTPLLPPFLVLLPAFLLISISPIHGQGRSCGSDESCVILSSCPPLLTLLQPPIELDNLKRLQDATCDESGAEPRVCCPHSSSPPSPATPTPSQPKGPTSSTLQRILSNPNLGLLPNSSNCGKSNPVDLTPDRVAGGEDAGLGTYPWMVLIGYSLTTGRGKPGPIQFGCGGTLINSNYVLTAAHCVAELPLGFEPVLVRVGEYNQSATLDCAEGGGGGGAGGGVCAPKIQDIPISSSIPHETYDHGQRKENDIALLRLSKHVAMGPFVSPICLPHGERLQKVSVRPWVAGWGRTTADNPDNSNVLQHVSVPFQSISKCNELYSAALGKDVDEGRFCAGGEKGKDSCKGDSGGPLMLALKAKSAAWALRVFQFGVVSLGPKDCDSSTFPALYTKVSYFMPWILDHLKP